MSPSDKEAIIQQIERASESLEAARSKDPAAIVVGMLLKEAAGMMLDVDEIDPKALINVLNLRDEESAELPCFHW